MSAIPAESSRPGHSRFRSGSSSGDPFWAAIVLVVFAASIYWFARSTLSIAGDLDGKVNWADIAGCLAALVFILAALATYSAHPRTRSSAASTTLAIMEAIMILAVVILFLTSMTKIDEQELREQAAFALVALFYGLVPLILIIGRR